METQDYGYNLEFYNLETFKREIAELTGKRHDNVKRTIETCSERGAIQLPPLANIEKINNLATDTNNICIRSNSMIPLNNQTLTMLSREIAELTFKDHKHVCRDIRVMVGQIRFQDGPNLDHEQIQGVTEIKDGRGYTDCFLLDKNYTLTLITGYSAALRMRIVQRWQELEAQAQQQVPSRCQAAKLRS